MAWDWREFAVFLGVAAMFRLFYLSSDLSFPPLSLFEPCQSSGTQGIATDGDEWGGGDVVHLNNPNFQSYIDSHSQWVLVMFHVPSCPHSQAAQYEYASAAQQLKKEVGDSIVFADVNCDNNLETCKTQKIDGYPTFYLFHNGKFVEEYQKERLTENFVAYGRSPPKSSWFRGWF